MGWTSNKTKLRLKVRDGAKWHDGKPVTDADIVWNLQRAANPKTGNPINFIWSSIINPKANGKVVTADLKSYNADIL